MNKYNFGYPEQCENCIESSECKISLKAKPFFRKGNDFRLMIIGQDPTIFNKPERVKEVLMLDDSESQLSRWLKGLFGEPIFNSITIYATNLLKCSSNDAPSRKSNNVTRFLEPYFGFCKSHIIKEVSNYKSNLVITLGEPAHKLFIGLSDTKIDDYDSMQKAYTGEFKELSINGCSFDYSPCLHIKTFRVAETYGESVKEFKCKIKSYFE